ncbi:GNAT family N-acetyltransferase [Candidatus Electronema sp. TJ]|uniref:GNAT family N-acetyltransferase n=1 Tax=Candidatus Electronema sp. TJ TaxID=3401573 RepID=UPI003AA89F3C
MGKIEKIMGEKKNEDSEKNFSILIRKQNGQAIGRLSCVDRVTAKNNFIIAALTTWRQRYMKYFMTQFQATHDRTRKWIEDIVIPSHNRILFLICLLDGEAIGNFGACNLSKKSGELDNLIRGKKGGDPQLIYFTEIALLNWMFDYLDYDIVKLRVFSNNYLTIRLHYSVGFSITHVVKLFRQEFNGTVEYIENYKTEYPVNFSCLHMELSRDIFYNMHPWVEKSVQLKQNTILSTAITGDQ